ncbi:MAG TPA: glycosyltransferase family 2 protein [Chloroflexia bacterium]|nr:glycosyltransferase family 2 protein [Chloroflexia bacterium]
MSTGPVEQIDGKLSLILPAHNEEPNIEAVVRLAADVLPRYFRDYEVLVVDDGSKDRTPELADALAAENPHVVALHHPKNRGYGGALTTGFTSATGDYLMFMDSDRQFDINDIANLVPYIGHYDIVAGYRIKRNDPYYRFLIGSSFNQMVKLLFQVDLRDIDCGFKVFKAEVLRDMDLTSPGALINTEIHAKANVQGRSVVEVGVNHYPRLEGEQSGASVRVMAKAIMETFRLWGRMRDYVPPDGNIVVAPASARGLVAVGTVGLAGLGTMAFLLSRLVRRRD